MCESVGVVGGGERICHNLPPDSLAVLRRTPAPSSHLPSAVPSCGTLCSRLPTRRARAVTVGGVMLPYMARTVTVGVVM